MLMILSGLPGSGKTTLAKKLEADLIARRFSPDEWMDLDYQKPAAFCSFKSRQDIEAEQLELALLTAKTGQSVVMEGGFWHSFEREHVLTAARSNNLRVGLIYLTAPIDVLIKRVLARKQTRLTEETMLTLQRRVFQAPTEAELAEFDFGAIIESK